MLDTAIVGLKTDELPIIHTDRGCYIEGQVGLSEWKKLA